MNINRNNYEEYFVLYIDNELNAVERAAVENFVEHNPDLKSELTMLQETILPSDSTHVFENKELLFRKEAEPVNELINDLNCEEYFVLYADNELTNDENGLVEEFVYRHPQHQENFEIIQEIKYQPEKHIVFPDKSSLYRSENDHKVVPMFTRMRAWKMAAAAAVLLMIGGTVWYALNTKVANTGTLAGNESRSATSPVAETTKPAEKVQPAENGIASAKTTSPVTLATENNPNGSIASRENGSVATSDKATSIDKSASTNKAASTDKAPTHKLQNEGVYSDGKTLAMQDRKKVSDQSNIITTPNVKQENGATKQIGTKITDDKTDLANRTIQVDKNIQVDKPQNTSSKNAADKSALVPSVKPDNNELLAAIGDNKNSTENSVAIGPVQLKSDNVFARMVNENDEEFEQSDKKNKMRGFFRKVTRVFDKATSREPAEERKGVRIASFSIGLK